MSFRMGRKGLCFVLQCWTGVLLFYLYQGAYGVRVLDITILSASNHTYVIQQEGAKITCEFELEGAEKLRSVHWVTRRGGKRKEFYVWEKEKRPSQALGAFAGNIDLRERDPHKLVITSANIEMHGDIMCVVKTTEHSNNKNRTLVVIIDACSDSNWKFFLDEETCVETVQFSCSGFYPKPTSNCGLYDRIKQSYIQSLPFDSIVESKAKRDNTYDLSVTRQYKASDFIDKHEDVALLCDIIVYEADYKFRTERGLFGEQGCPTNYPFKGVDANVTRIKETCWNGAANGSVIGYQCDSSESVKMITCNNGNWIDESDGTISDEYCNDSPALYERQIVLSIIVSGALMFFMW